MATFFNQAQLTYNGRTVNSNTVSAELVGAITAEKTATLNTYASGDRVTYVISLRNTGGTDITGLTVTDDLGTNTAGDVTTTPLTYVDGSVLYYTNGNLQPTPAVDAAQPPLTVNNITVPAGGDAVIVYEADVNGTARLNVGDSILNTATVTGDALAAPVTADETILAAEEPDLSISKSVSPDTVTENGQVTYTFVVENNGNTAAADTVVITDTFDPVLENIAVTIDGAPAAETADYTYDTGTGQFATTAGIITVPAATYTENPDTGEISVNPGTVTVRVTGTV